ncbi:helicase HerA domain-containing protein [Halarchaeum sp. P4]|uniref:ATP-binding protein n=1 Tax=Halarchaeum sp. P4 TaxID=3421639 RepID=UPI003EBE1039
MSADDGVDERHLPVGETADGDPLELPTVEILTGRGFVTGKSGGGKSNTTSVVLEELLERQYPVMVVDTDGEYYGLKEEYELLHAGADEGCDIQVSPEHAERLATIALEENVPVILDVSGFLDENEADELVFETARHLFAKEKKLKKPFLLVIEEVHEYIPEGAGLGETGRMLIKVGKRGRKHGLGVVGISQRPADVKKDFITQANWLVWHRLTWENDTKVVGRIVGSEYKDEVPDLDAGEAFVQADWTDEAVQRVQFKRKRTFDAGATPGLDDFERPELKSVSDTLVEDLSDITSAEEQRQDRIADLERKLENREARIAELEEELDRARDVSAAARKLANAVAHGDVETTQATLADGDADGESGGAAADVAALRERIDELEARLAEAEAARAETATDERSTESGTDAGESAESDDHAADDVDSIEAQLAELGTDDGDGSDATEVDAAASEYGDLEPDESIEDVLERLQQSSERERAERELGTNEGAGRTRTDRARNGPASESASTPASRRPSGDADFDSLLDAPAVQVRLDAARRASQCNDRVATAVYDALAEAPRTAHALADATDTTVEAVHSLLVELRGRNLVVKDGERRYAFHGPSIRDLAADSDERAELGELGEQWRVS